MKREENRKIKRRNIPERIAKHLKGWSRYFETLFLIISILMKKKKSYI